VRVLVVLPGYLGDTVFLGPAVRALKARWPSGTVGLCVTPRGAPVARLLPGCDEVFVYDKRGLDRGPRGFLRVARRLRAFAPGLALVAHPSLRSGALAYLSGAARRVGFAPLCNERVPLDRAVPFVERSLGLARRVGAKGDGALALRPFTGADGYLARALAGAGRPLVGIVPGAEWATKRWPVERYAELARGLTGGGASCVVLGGPKERVLAARMRELLGENLIDTTGNSIEEALAVLARCDLVVGGDTGLVHCARALGRRALVLFGPTDPGRHLFRGTERAMALGLECQPCHDHGPRRCPLGHHACMERVESLAMLGAARELLDPPAGGDYGPAERDELGRRVEPP
jgi:heptosyltransferase II